MRSAIVNGDIFDGLELKSQRAVIFENGVVTDIVDENRLPNNISAIFDLDDGLLVPGFIDVQVNGGGGVLFNDDPSVDGVRAIGAAHRQFGTTGYLPTVITDRLDVIEMAVDAVRKSVTNNVPGVLGIHIEGPYLAEAKKGAHDASLFRRLDDEGVELLSSLKEGVTVVTLAPELADETHIRELVNRGVMVCAGHSAANHDETKTAIKNGVSGFTHLFNAMTPLSSRDPGMVGAAIEDEASWFGIIADGHHVHSSMFRLAVSNKRKGGALLVTDAMPTVGSSNDSFVLNGEEIQSKDGRCMNAAGSLAGSDLDMLTAINNAADFAGIEWFEAVRMASLYPAMALGLDTELGRIARGCKANFVAMDGEKRVRQTWIDGEPS